MMARRYLLVLVCVLVVLGMDFFFSIQAWHIDRPPIGRHRMDADYGPTPPPPGVFPG
jgi:hypothetical protein